MLTISECTHTHVLKTCNTRTFARMSTESWTEPGMTLEAPGHTCSSPTVHTSMSSSEDACVCFVCLKRERENVCVSYPESTFQRNALNQINRVAAKRNHAQHTQAAQTPVLVSQAFSVALKPQHACTSLRKQVSFTTYLALCCYRSPSTAALNC